MLVNREISPGIYHVGGIDRRLSRFENMFPLDSGVSYNSYLIIDEKTALLDAVDKSIAESFYASVKEVLGDRKLDYFFINHVEPDHCNTINGILRLYPEVKLVLNKKAFDLLQQFYREEDYSQYNEPIIVKEGNVIDLGEHKIEHIFAPMVHWPEVTMLYEEKSGFVFSADAFGSFKAPDGHLFVDQVNYARDWMSENRRYYWSIVGRHGKQVGAVLQKLAAKEIKGIAPLHGLVFRRPEDARMIIEKYKLWSEWQPEEKGVVLVYGSLYDNSALVCDNLAALLAERGVENIRVYDVAETHSSYIIADLNRFSNAVFACNNYNMELYLPMDAFLRDLMHMNWDNRKIALIHNQSWGGKALKTARDILAAGKNIEELCEPLQIKSSPAHEQIDDLRAMADAIAEDCK